MLCSSPNNCFQFSLQKSMSKEDDICRQYDEELVRYRHDVDSLTKQTNQIVLERNQVVLERNELIHERDQLVLQSQQEYERAERSIASYLHNIMWQCTSRNYLG